MVVKVVYSVLVLSFINTKALISKLVETELGVRVRVKVKDFIISCELVPEWMPLELAIKYFVPVVNIFDE